MPSLRRFFRTLLATSTRLVQSLPKSVLLDSITREQLRYGNWDVNMEGGQFSRMWFEIVDHAPQGLRLCRAWDLAGSEPSETHRDPDYTAGCLMGYHIGTDLFYIMDMRHIRKRSKDVEDLVMQCAKLDGPACAIRMEQEGGSAGKAVIENYTELLKGYSFKGEKPTGSTGQAGSGKVTRSKMASAAAERGQIKLLNGPWIVDFLMEIERFPSPGFHLIFGINCRLTTAPEISNGG